MAGDAVFLYSIVCRHIRRKQSLLQPLLRTRTAFGTVRRKAEIIAECGAAQIFTQPVVSLWISDLLYGYVRLDVIQHLSGIYRCAPVAGCDAFVDVQAPLAVGRRELCGPVDWAVCLWLFRSYAHLYRFRACDNGVVPAPVVVRILPDGKHDTGNLQIKKRKEGKRIWKNVQRR